METIDNTPSESAAGAEPAARGRRTTSTRRTTGRKTATAASTSTQPRTPIQLAERAVLVPVGAGLILGDDIVSTVKGLVTKYQTRAGVERELKRYEKRGASARVRFERQVTRRRKKFERELRQRRRGVERSVRQNRRRLEREVRQVRKDVGRAGKDFAKQSEVVSARVGGITSRVEELVSNAQGLMS